MRRLRESRGRWKNEQCWRRIPEENPIQREASDRVKRERIIDSKLTGGNILRRGQGERCCSGETSAKGDFWDWDIRSKGVKWLGTGSRVSRGWISQRVVGRKRSTFNGSRCRRAVSNESRHRLLHLDTVGVALAPLHEMSPGRHTQNWSLHYKRLEGLTHRVSREKQNAKYFFFLMVY